MCAGCQQVRSVDHTTKKNEDDDKLDRLVPNVSRSLIVRRKMKVQREKEVM
jgi:hypothetical protein